MHSPRLFLAARISLCLLVIGGFAVLFFVRAPEGTSANAIFRHVQLTGRADEVVHQCAALVRKTVALHGEGSTEQLVPVRSQLLFLVGVCDALTEDIDAERSQWIQVAEAADLIEQCRGLCQLTLDKMLTSTASIPPGDAPLEDDREENASAVTAQTQEPQPTRAEATASWVLTERPEDVGPVLQNRSEQLLDRSSELQQRVEQAIESGLFARGTLWGLSASVLLLTGFVLAALIGLAVLWYASRRLEVSPERLVEIELELLAQKDRPAALRGCHERVQGLLELADGFCRDGTI